jgi:hypothetical protein
MASPDEVCAPPAVVVTCHDQAGHGVASRRRVVMSLDIRIRIDMWCALRGLPLSLGLDELEFVSNSYRNASYRLTHLAVATIARASEDTCQRMRLGVTAPVPAGIRIKLTRVSETTNEFI